MKTNLEKLACSGAWMLLSAILLIAFWIRIQGVDTIPDGQFTGNDAYLYHWQAQIIADHGRLPARDMHRWVPLGRDLGQTLNVYSYCLAYVHKAITFLFPNVSLYHISLFAPVVCFVIGLGALCIFLYRAFGLLFSGVVGVLLATLPGTIERSAAGFSDRDSWCLMLGVLAITTYLASLRPQYSRYRILFTLISGAAVVLGGLSWEGFGVFILIILGVELWRFLTTQTEEHLAVYLLWVCTYVPTLFLASPAYRHGEGFATHLFAYVLVPPLMLLGIRCLRCLLITREPIAKKLRPHARSLALVLTLAILTGALLYFFTQQDTFATSTVPLSQNRLMQSVGELRTPEYRYWVFRYGSVFFLGSLGLMSASIHLWKNLGAVLIPPFALFTLTTFFEGKLEGHLGATFCNILFFASIAYIVIGFLLIAWRRNTPPKHEHCYVAVAAWFLFWVALARDAVRYDFFIGVPIAFFAATLIQFLSDALSTKLNARRVPRQLLKAGITVASLIVLMCWTPAGAHAKRTLFAARHMRQAMPGHTKIEKTFRWMKAQLPGPAVVAASWSYGSQLNVLGGVRTVTDQDHFIQHWIHLYYRHVYCAQSDAEALEFLKTHRATHLMLTAEDVLQFAPRHSSLGSDADRDRQFQLIPLRMRTYEGGRPALVPVAPNTPFTHINIAQGSERDTPFTTVAKLKNGNTVEMSYVAFIGKTRIHSQNQIELKAGGIVLFFSEQQQLQNGYYIPQIGWNSLAVRLFFRGESPSVFAPVYPANSNVTAEVKVWEIRYPPEITTHPKFLATDPGR